MNTKEQNDAQATIAAIVAVIEAVRTGQLVGN